MKHRFSVELEFRHITITQDHAQEVLRTVIERGLTSIGHGQGITVNVEVEKLRARSIDPSKPIGEQE